MERMTAFYEYWRRHPPTHLLVAAFMGYKPSAPAPAPALPPQPELPEMED